MDHFDHIFIINLKPRQERRGHIDKQLHILGLKEGRELLRN